MKWDKVHNSPCGYIIFMTGHFKNRFLEWITWKKSQIQVVKILTFNIWLHKTIIQDYRIITGILNMFILL
jgi:hypothetical protein